MNLDALARRIRAREAELAKNPRPARLRELQAEGDRLAKALLEQRAVWRSELDALVRQRLKTAERGGRRGAIVDIAG
ncbi:MAG: hypothetical protein SFV18_17085 [Bryobacteraceae bacterium]|jgi:hypothetical protein|nr:hypothetical protein [Bryobacteraceae bacterium]